LSITTAIVLTAHCVSRRRSRDHPRRRRGAEVSSSDAIAWAVWSTSTAVRP